MIIPSRSISDEAYGESWNGIITYGASKNAIYDAISGINAADDTAYDATTWDSVTDVAPSKNAVRDKIETLAAKGDNSDITSLLSFTSGSNNMLFTYSLTSFGTGQYNVLIGNAGGELFNAANYNVCIGYNTSNKITTADDNIHIGYNAGEAITTGNSNVAIGTAAANYLTTDGYNTAVGAYAMSQSQAASSSHGTAIGYAAGYGTEGSANVFVGSQAGAAQTVSKTMAESVAIGRDALKNCTDNVSQTIAIGDKCADDAAGTLTDCIYIGANIVPGNNVTNEIVIGTGVTGAGSNTTSIGTTATATTVLYGRLDLSHTDAGQIQFPSAVNPSSDANTLDDYEEGNWTPTVDATIDSTGETYTTQSGTYVCVGRNIQVTGRVQLTTKGDLEGNLSIGGLPFSNGGTGHNVVATVLAENLTSISSEIIGYISTDTSEIRLGTMYYDEGTSNLEIVRLTDNYIQSTSLFTFSAIYRRAV